MADVKPYNSKTDVMSEYCDRCFCHNIWQIILYDMAYFGPHMQWEMLLPYVMVDVIAIYEYLWQMFVLLLITLVSLLVLLP